MTDPKKTNADLSPREAIIDQFALEGHSCHGCEKTGTAFMVTGIVYNDPRKGGQPAFYDLFATRIQAEKLRDKLIKALS